MNFVIVTGVMTWRTLRAMRRAGAGYFRDNLMFWARRISGLAIMALLVFHLYAFSYTAEGVFRLRWFTGARLATQLMLLASIAERSYACRTRFSSYRFSSFSEIPLIFAASTRISLQ